MTSASPYSCYVEALTMFCVRKKTWREKYLALYALVDLLAILSLKEHQSKVLTLQLKAKAICAAHFTLKQFSVH